MLFVTMTPFITVVVSLLIALIEASPTPTVCNVEPTSQRTSAIPEQVHTRWSRQDIFTLVSVFVSVIGVFISVLVASSTVREWLYRPFRRKFITSYLERTLPKLT
jgi:beta-lactamase regulating signal transducer with metallopeptidase domain